MLETYISRCVSPIFIIAKDLIMFDQLFNPQQPVQLSDFLQSTEHEPWDYLSVLRIKPGQLHQATREQIMDNPGDVAIGVNQVEVVIGQFFFGMFRSLVIKHHDDGEVRLMFNGDITDGSKVTELFKTLNNQLKEGFHYEPKFASFHDTIKVKALASGRYDSAADELLHFWPIGRFGFTLNYKIEPLRQLVFIVSRKPENLIDTKRRDKGTLMHLLKHVISEVFLAPETKAEPFIENEELKFIDYSYKVNPPELGLFEWLVVRIFGAEKSMSNVKSLLVTYQTEHQVSLSSIIRLVDEVVKIYGADSSGYEELRPHEVDMIEEDNYWSGRSWFINQHHGLQDMSDSEQHTLYWITLTLDVGEGLRLSVLGFEEMERYNSEVE